MGLFLCWVLKNYSDSDIIKSAKPIEYKHRGNLSFYRMGALFFQYVRITNLIKMQVLSIRMCLIALYIELVWRLSEFAFFVRLLRWSHFLFLRGGMKTKMNTKKASCGHQFNNEAKEYVINMLHNNRTLHIKNTSSCPSSKFVQEYIDFDSYEEAVESKIFLRKCKNCFR